jgi:hypothetical protein
MTLPDPTQIYDAFKHGADALKDVGEVATSLRNLFGPAGTPNSQSSALQPGASASPSGHPVSYAHARESFRYATEQARTKVARARSSFGTWVIQSVPGETSDRLEDAYNRADKIVGAATRKLDDLERAMLKEELAQRRGANNADRKDARQEVDKALAALRGAQTKLARAEDLARKPLAPRNLR